MAQQLYLRCKCEILLKRAAKEPLRVDGSGAPYTFEVLKKNRLVRLEVMEGGETIEGKTVIDAPSQELLNILATANYDSLNDQQKKALSELQAPIYESIRQLVGLMKQELPDFEISDELIANCKGEWSVDYKTWQSVPSGLQLFVDILATGPLCRAKADHIQGLLSEDETALIAINHLHRAQAEHGLRYKWIDATIAAELAIKEILIRIEPKLEVILTEVPSPPLRILYREVLSSIAGESLNNKDLDKLAKASKTRNDLIHRPESVPLDHDEVTDYVRFVDRLIKWLLDISRKKRREASQ